MNASVNATKMDLNNAISVQSSTSRIQKKKSRIPRKPIKQAEFQAFLQTLKTPGVKAHWQEIAAALGVAPATISDWQMLPEAIEAKKIGIKRAMEGMAVAGVNDWKMHQAKLRMLRVDMNDNELGGARNTQINIYSDKMADGLKTLSEALQL